MDAEVPGGALHSRLGGDERPPRHEQRSVDSVVLAHGATNSSAKRTASLTRPLETTTRNRPELVDGHDAARPAERARELLDLAQLAVRAREVLGFAAYGRHHAATHPDLRSQGVGDGLEVLPDLIWARHPGGVPEAHEHHEGSGQGGRRWLVGAQAGGEVVDDVRADGRGVLPTFDGQTHQHVRFVEVDPERHAPAGELGGVAMVVQQVGEEVVAGLALGLDLATLREHLQGKHGGAAFGQLRVEVAERAAGLDDGEIAAGSSLDDQAADQVAASQPRGRGRLDDRRWLRGRQSRDGGAQRGAGPGALAQHRRMGHVQ